MCKHELAVRLAPSVGKLLHRELEDEEWAKQLDYNLTSQMAVYSSEDVNTGPQPDPFAHAPQALMPPAA